MIGSTETCMTSGSASASTQTPETPSAVSPTSRGTASPNSSDEASWQSWLSTAIDNDEIWITEIERRIGPLIRRIGRGRRGTDLEIEDSWNRVLVWFWLELQRDSIISWQHLENLACRQFCYLLAIAFKKRQEGFRMGFQRSAVMGDALLDATARKREHASPPDDLRRCEHPDLGSCRIDLAAAFDQLSQARREVVAATLVGHLRAVEIDELEGRKRGSSAIIKHKALKQLRECMNGTHTRRLPQNCGPLMRFVPTPHAEPGYVWQKVS
ncbi:MAG: hypothetical protein AAF356_01775 [Planctomycetota bacterium]